MISTTMVDETEVPQEAIKVKRFGYTNNDGTTEFVECAHHSKDVLVFKDKFGDETSAFYVKDIPNIIKALQALEAYLKEGK